MTMVLATAIRLLNKCFWQQGCQRLGVGNGVRGFKMRPFRTNEMRYLRVIQKVNAVAVRGSQQGIPEFLPRESVLLDHPHLSAGGCSDEHHLAAPCPDAVYRRRSLLNNARNRIDLGPW